jgi:hypothetical protein
MLKQEFCPQAQNRFFRRRARKLKLVHHGYLLLIIDRTQWQERNLIPGMSQFYEQIIWTQSHQVKGFNLAIYWRRKYRKKVQKEPWYILTTLKTQKLTLSLYARRWSIETLFRDCKTRGDNLEKTKVNERRLMGLILLITIAYTLANFQGELVKKLRTTEYVGRPTEKQRSIPRHSYLGMGLNCLAYLQALTIWSSVPWNRIPGLALDRIPRSDLAHRLMALKPHKSLDFPRGLKAVSTLQSALSPCCHPLR